LIAWEAHGRLLLVVHTVLAAALVAVTTHLVVYMRGFLRGRWQRRRAVRRFAVLALLLYAGAFTVGNLLYPQYKVRVRTEYLDSQGAIAADLQARAAAAAQARDHHLRATGALPAAAPPPAASARDPLAATLVTTRVARWFDIKEHWAALGLALALATCAILLTWPAESGEVVAARVAFGLALALCLVSWLAALVGIVVTSFRPVGLP
jgi:hypothetical protein